MALKAAEAAKEKKAAGVVVLQLTGLTVIADYFVICSGENRTHVKALADFIEEELARKGFRLFGMEGIDNRQWVLLDFGDVVIHIFDRETRAYYSLEKLWLDAEIIETYEDKADMGRKDKRRVHK